MNVIAQIELLKQTPRDSRASGWPTGYRRRHVVGGASVGAGMVMLMMAVALMAGSAQAQPQGAGADVPSRSDFQAQFDAAMEAVQRGQYQDARLTLEALLQRSPNDLQVNRSLAIIYDRLSMDIRQNTDDPNAGDKADALQEQAVKFYLRAAKLARNEDNTGTVEQMYNRVLAINPSHAEALLGVADILSETNRVFQAIERYKEYLKNPAGQQDKAYLELGKAYLAGKYWLQAVDALKEAGKLDTTNAEVDINLAQAYFNLQRPNEARSAAERAISKAPEAPEHRNALALLLLSHGDIGEALESANKAIELAKQKLMRKPDDGELLRQMSGYYETQMRILRTMLVENEGNAVDLRLQLAQAIQDQSAANQQLSFHLALEELDKLAAEDQGKLKVLLMRAALEMSAYRFDDAAATCQRILKLDSDNAEAKKMLRAIEGRSSSSSSGSTGNAKPAG